MFHEIIENSDGGLELWVEMGKVAVIRERHGSVDLVWSIHGPLGLEKARQVIMALPDLLVQYDLLSQRSAAKRRKPEGE